LLAEALVQRLNHQYGRKKSLHVDMLAFLESHPWPGNVRELENFIHREYLLADTGEIRSAQAPTVNGAGSQLAPALTDSGFRQAKARAVAEFERAYIIELLTRTRGNVSLAARLSGKERSRLGKLARKHGLARDDFRLA
jgi:DNA-binding NtrC family response regulator